MLIILPRQDGFMQYVEWLALVPVPFVPEIVLHQGDDMHGLWEQVGTPAPPYWAFPWLGGQALARYVLEAGVERVLNAFVQLWAQLAQLVGFALQLLQNGNLQRYLAIFVLALTCLLAAWRVPVAGLSRRPVLMQLPAGGETE